METAAGESPSWRASSFAVTDKFPSPHLPFENAVPVRRPIRRAQTVPSYGLIAWGTGRAEGDALFELDLLNNHIKFSKLSQPAY
jgi:hypothetical protein